MSRPKIIFPLITLSAFLLFFLFFIPRGLPRATRTVLLGQITNYNVSFTFVSPSSKPFNFVVSDEALKTNILVNGSCNLTSEVGEIFTWDFSPSRNRSCTWLRPKVPYGVIISWSENKRSIFPNEFIVEKSIYKLDLNIKGLQNGSLWLAYND